MYVCVYGACPCQNYQFDVVVVIQRREWSVRVCINHPITAKGPNCASLHSPLSKPTNPKSAHPKTTRLFLSHPPYSGMVGSKRARPPPGSETFSPRAHTSLSAPKRDPCGTPSDAHPHTSPVAVRNRKGDILRSGGGEPPEYAAPRAPWGGWPHAPLKYGIARHSIKDTGTVARAVPVAPLSTVSPGVGPIKNVY